MNESAETRFRAMGTEAHVIVVGADAGLLDLAERHVAWLEDRWSRFRAASDVSVMNAMAGMPVRVEPETVLLVQRALEGFHLTEGRYDPTVLGAVVRAGYGRSYEQLADLGSEVLDAGLLERGASAIVVDEGAGTVAMPEGVGFDPGGIGKGLAADLVVAGLLAAGAAGACVNLGGDVRVEGASPEDAGWLIALEHPFREEPAAVVTLRSGAVATTSRVKRVLGPDGQRHHVIDPRTGESARSGLASATAIAAEGWQAEILAKAAFLAGPREGRRLLAGPRSTPWAGTTGLLVDDGGALLDVPGFDRYARVLEGRAS
jgi:thiamine biosynthesis lipoprotein